MISLHLGNLVEENYDVYACTLMVAEHVIRKTFCWIVLYTAFQAGTYG
jgi:hypothetical protein